MGVVSVMMLIKYGKNPVQTDITHPPQALTVTSKVFTTLKQKKILVMGNNVTLIKVTDKEWKMLEKEFPNRLTTQDITFYSDNVKSK
jgi:CRISPR/Cas system endoribonuclease Cas6 (RAMP superfamily)